MYLHLGEWKLLPLQGARLIALIPRVLPWAGSFCPIIKLLKEYKDSTCNLKLLNGEQRGEHLPKVFTFSAPG